MLVVRYIELTISIPIKKQLRFNLYNIRDLLNDKTLISIGLFLDL